MNLPVTFSRSFACQIAFLAVCMTSAGVGQTYPRWFLEQGAIAPSSHVGYAEVGYYRDSAVAFALRNACENASWCASSHISGQREHWATELGTFVMDDNIRETFDSAAAGDVGRGLVVLDSMSTGSMVIVLAAPEGISLPAAALHRVRLTAEQTPAWVQSPPDEDAFIYATGLAAEYFYEKSSWLQAERVARKNLGFSVFTRLKSLQRVAEQAIEKSREELSVTLHHIQVVARWRDTKNRIMHVLVRMPRM